MLAQGAYCERLGTVLLVNVPVVFRFGWQIIKPWLNKRTADRVHMFGGAEAWRAPLREARAEQPPPSPPPPPSLPPLAAWRRRRWSTRERPLTLVWQVVDEENIPCRLGGLRAEELPLEAPPILKRCWEARPALGAGGGPTP